MQLLRELDDQNRVFRGEPHQQMKLLNHSSPNETMRYIGIDQEELDEAYLELNL